MYIITYLDNTSSIIKDIKFWSVDYLSQFLGRSFTYPSWTPSIVSVCVAVPLCCCFSILIKQKLEHRPSARRTYSLIHNHRAPVRRLRCFLLGIFMRRRAVVSLSRTKPCADRTSLPHSMPPTPFIPTSLPPTFPRPSTGLLCVCRFRWQLCKSEDCHTTIRWNSMHLQFSNQWNFNLCSCGHCGLQRVFFLHSSENMKILYGNCG